MRTDPQTPEMDADGGVTFHLVRAEYWRTAEAAQPYVPEMFATEGFIHCTDGVDNLVDVANRYYAADLRMYVALVIDKARVAPEIRYEDPDAIYPHIYGPLNRDAIMRVVPMLRSAGGMFVRTEL
jgi:uncharacterized protein (DUF952 family)